MELARGLEISTAKGCAWRAVYFATLTIGGDAAGWKRPVERRQFAHIGIDPTASRANIFGAIGRLSFHVNIPCMSWKQSQWHIRTLWQRAIRSLDGRFV